MKYFVDALKKYAVFTGRARRREYWIFVFIGALVIPIVIGIVLGFLMSLLGVDGATGAEYINLVSIVYALLIITPGISVAIRRMHDIGKSGWWVIVPFLNVVYLFLDSQPSSNVYGKNPKGIS